MEQPSNPAFNDPDEPEPEEETVEPVESVEMTATPVPPSGEVVTFAEQQQKRRAEALSLRLAGFTYAQIAERLKINESSAHELVNRRIVDVDENIEQLRAIENARLDKAQSAIWNKVLGGDEKAIDAFLRISQRRSRLNGMDAPQKVELGVRVRTEMEQALGELRQIVMEQIEDADVIDEDGDEAESDRDRD